jgi:transcription elongation factor GreA
MNDEVYLTAEGMARLKAELAELKGVRREELAKRLRAAIQEGDLSENADYHKAKEDQSFLEGRIQELEYAVANAVLIDESNRKRERVEVGARVTVQEEDYDPETYQVVGAKEADPRNGRISNESPIGKALLNHQEGDTVIAHTPAGQITLKILRIE